MPQFTIRPLEETGSFSLEGELDMASAPEVLARLDGSGNGRLVLDLERLTFMDSSGLRALIDLTRSRGEGTLVLRNMPPNVHRVFELALPSGMQGMEVEEG